jgi:lysophospholipase L1-like esterase
MKKILFITVIALLSVFDGGPPAFARPSTAHPLSIGSAAGAAPVHQAGTVRILTIGDSRSSSGLWQQEFCRYMATTAGLTCDVRNESVAGTRCTYWPDRIKGLLAKHEPEMVFLFCGTNDDTSTQAARDQMGWAFRYTVEAIRTYRPARPIPIVPAIVQYSDPLIAPQWLLDGEPRANDVLWTNMQYYLPAHWFPGVANFQQIPATADYLDDGGIHPTLKGQNKGESQFESVQTHKGYRTMGRIVYDSIFANQGWPAPTEPPLCGMYGHRKGYPRPPYTPCP